MVTLSKMSLIKISNHLLIAISVHAASIAIANIVDLLLYLQIFFGNQLEGRVDAEPQKRLWYY
jgi:hypothetical protein